MVVTDQIFPVLQVFNQDKRLRLIGKYLEIILSALVNAMGARAFSVLGMSPEEIEAFLQVVQTDIKDIRYHSYMEYIFWMGQKPE